MRRATTLGSSTPDPVAGACFVVKIPGLVIGYFSEVSGLSVEYEVVEYQEGGENGFRHRLRGPAKQSDLTLKRGITHEGALFKWFRRCQDGARPLEGTIELLGPDGKSVRTWSFSHAFPVKWEGPNLKSASGEIATETLVIAHRGLNLEQGL